MERPQGYWNSLWPWNALRAHCGYSCTCVRWQRDERAMNVRCIFLGAPENLGFLGRAEALVARRFNRGPQRRLRLFARMGRGGALERFISACRNPLAKSATTKAIGYATQVPNASAKVRCELWCLQIFREINKKSEKIGPLSHFHTFTHFCMLNNF